MVLQTEFAQIKGNDLYIDDVKATDLVKQYGTHGRLVKRLRRCVLSAESMGSNPIPVTRKGFAE